MISRLALLGIASLVLASSPAGAVGKKKDVSWGKPSVTFDQYRADALECANLAYGVEVQPRPIGTVTTGFNGVFLPTAYIANVTPQRAFVYTSTLVEAYRYAVRLDAIEQLQARVDSCLLEKGYSPFRLTPQQMSVLKTMPQSAPERQVYLHSLGSNGSLLAAQKL